jgi:hypothetical protein
VFVGENSLEPRLDAEHKTFLETVPVWYTMAVLIKPPPIKFKTDRTNKKFWTLHYTSNKVLGFTAEPKTLVIGFAKQNDAIIVGKNIENHVITKQEWPDFSEFPEFNLQGSKPGTLDFLVTKQWDFDDLKIWCTLNCLDFVSVERMSKRHVNSSTWQLSGAKYGFDAPYELYQQRFEELLNSDQE